MKKMFKMKKIILILTAVIGVNSWAEDLTPVATKVACSPEVEGLANFGIGIVSEAFTEELPFFGPFAGLLTGALKEGLCPEDMSTSDRLDQVDKQIEGLTNRMDEMDKTIKHIEDQLTLNGVDLKTLRQEMYADFADGYLDAYTIREQDFKDYVQAYRNLRGSYPSLKEYSQAYPGGFFALYKDPLFSFALSSSDIVLSKLKAIMPTNADAIRLNSYLNKMCGRLDNDTGGYVVDVTSLKDVVSQRVRCNLIRNDIAMNIAKHTLEARGILLDYIATVLAAKSTPNLTKEQKDILETPSLSNYNVDDTPNLKYADKTLTFENQPSAKEAVKVTNEYLRAVRTIFIGKVDKDEDMFTPNANANREKMIPLYEGFNQDLLKTIGSICTDPKTKAAAIAEWWPNNLEQDQNNNLYPHPYIVTTCPTIAGSSITTPTARGKTYYNDTNSYNDGTKWNNILGVLVRNAAVASVVMGSSVKTEKLDPDSNLFNIKFVLNSNVPLEINSMAPAGTNNIGTDENGQTLLNMKNIGFVQAGQYKPINLSYVSEDTDGKNTNVTINKLSQILAPRVSESNKIFDSSIYIPSVTEQNIVQVYSSTAPVAYLSFKDDSNTTHIFALGFSSAWHFGDTAAYAEVSTYLTCLDSNECVASDANGAASITWTNGSSISISQPGSGSVSIVANTKVNPQ